MVFFLKGRLLPDLALKVVLASLLDSIWGNGRRRTIVRFFVHGNRVEIGVGEGNIKEWEIDALRASPIHHEWFKIGHLDKTYVPGIKYVPGGKTFGMPQELIPVKSGDICVFVSDVKRIIFPAYRCFDINLGEERILSIISPSTVIRDIAETAHPAFSKEKHGGKVNNVEVKLEALKYFFERGYGIGILRKTSLLNIKNQTEAFPLLGNKDIKIILTKIDLKEKPCSA